MKTLIKLVIVISIATICLLFSSCKQEPIIETEIITVNDTLIVSTTDTVVISTTDTVVVSTTDTILITDEAEVTTFILVRHAEVSPVGNDPVLSPEGVVRSVRLASMLSEIMLDRVYSTDFNRTRQTAGPTADDQGLNISDYGGFDQNQVIDDVLANVNEGKVLIVGHSNTTANFLNALTGTSDYADLPEDAYDNLFIVRAKSRGDAEVIHLKY